MHNETYYCPPKEWTFNEVRQRYERLARSYRVKEPLSLEYPYESELIKLKHALWDISKAIKKQDSAAMEIATEFVLSDVFFHYSGYIRATMARRLKSATLSETSKERIRRGLFRLFLSDAFGPEHKEFARLLRNIGLGSMEEEYRKLLQGGGKQQMVAKEIYSSHLTMPSTERAKSARR
jgi:hypothetical protein